MIRLGFMLFYFGVAGFVLPIFLADGLRLI
jgi:hypothetical protein